MKTNRALPVSIVAMVLVLAAASVQAVDPAARCEASKVKAMGKYVGCLANLDAKAAITGVAVDPVATAKCADKFINSWDKAQANGGGMCADPPGADASIAQATAALCAAWAAGYAQGGNPDICTGVCDTCTADLATCNDDLGVCSGSLGTCNGNLNTCNGSLTSCNSGLGACTSDLSTAQGNLTTCASDLGTCNGGTAVAGNVLTGKTFSSTAGLGVTGTMTNVGQQTVTPGTSPVSITRGYHDGTGSVAGDADLVAANITSGVNVFGVAGAALPAQPLKTGQTICYNAAGTVIACAGTGQDGELRKGVARSFADNGNGTITDNVTGLMWEKISDDGSIHDKDNTYTWTNGFVSKVAMLNSMSFAGHDDWRVPSSFELFTLVSHGAVNPSTYPAFNTACASACTVLTCSCTIGSKYWSSTTWAVDPSWSWWVNFYDGGVVLSPKADSYAVRAVRGGM